MNIITIWFLTITMPSVPNLPEIKPINYTAQTKEECHQRAEMYLRRNENATVRRPMVVICTEAYTLENYPH